MVNNKFKRDEASSSFIDGGGGSIEIEDSGQNSSIVLKMAQIRSNLDNWTIYLGALFLGLTVSICSGAVIQLSWNIQSKLGYFDVGPVFDVISGLLIILFVPLFATFSDVYGRGLILTLTLVLCLIGLFVGGNIPGFGAYYAGNIIFVLGEAGRSLLFPIILADFLTPRNRGFGFVINWLPSVISLGASIPVITAAKEGEKWRWLYNGQGIMTIITGIPILFGLFNLQMKANRLLPQFNYKTSSLFKVDWIGIILLTAGFGCILIPFSFVVREINGWASPAIFLPIIFGILILSVFMIWEVKYTKHPLVARKILSNSAAMVMIFVRAFLAFSSCFTWIYMASYLSLTRDIDEDHVARIYLGYYVTWYVSGLICAFFIKRFNCIRDIVWISLIVKAIGMGLALRSRHPHTEEWFVVFAEAAIGLGSGFFECASLVILQNTVEFSEIANVSAVDNLLTNVFTTIAISIVNTLWNSFTWTHLMNHLPEQYHALIPSLLANNKYNELLPPELKDKWVSALGDSQWIMCTISTVLSCFCFFVSLLLPSVDLNKLQQNPRANEIAMDNSPN